MSIPFELQALANASRYQKWMYETVAPFLGKRILEIGAGIGNLSQWLPHQELLVLSEMNESLLSLLKSKLGSQKNTVIQKLDSSDSLAQQVAEFNLDTIVSFNVMEHIQDDLQALKNQIEILQKSSASGPKRLVALVPAQPWAYGSLDRLFEHYRRYDKARLLELAHQACPEAKLNVFYFNVLSMPGWVLAGKILKQNEIKLSQMKLVEAIIPFWRPVDYLLTRILRLPLGQSLVLVMELN